MSRARLLVASALVAATGATFAPSASAVECPPPVVSTVCWAWGTVCRNLPQEEIGRLDVHMLLCTVAA